MRAEGTTESLGATTGEEVPALSDALNNIIRSLASLVEAVNDAGNIHGLFAAWVLRKKVPQHVKWGVLPGATWVDENRDRLSHAPVVAALGYVLALGADANSEIESLFIKGLERVQQRDPFPEDRISFAFDSVQLLGLALGIQTIGDQKHGEWLSGILDDSRSTPEAGPPIYMQAVTRRVIGGDAEVIAKVESLSSIECAAVAWCATEGVRVVLPGHIPSDIDRRVLSEAALVNLRELVNGCAAILISGIETALLRSVDEVLLSRDHLLAVINRFEASMRRWRWDSETLQSPVRWPIASEREVQDVLWIILRSVFEDVIDEEHLPKLGHSSYKPDFAIPSLRVFVEVKFARSAADFKRVEKEVLEDSAAYLSRMRRDYDGIVVFIYDASASVEQHALTSAALKAVDNVIDVVIVSSPSQLRGID